MPLPELIEILPLKGPVRAQIRVPGSKSITNRALILAALARGRTKLSGALWSEDTQVMVDCLQRLGFVVEVSSDLEEPCNRTISVEGRGGEIPNRGTRARPLELFVGNAGTAARFLAAFVCLGAGSYRLDGIPRMRERPQKALFEALRQLGYEVDSPNSRLPATIHSSGPRTGKCEVSIEESSQFASALVLSGQIGGWDVRVTGSNSEESPYLEMTTELVASFPSSGGEFRIEPDASSGSYFWAANFLLRTRFPESHLIVRDWPESGWQVDARFPEFLPLPANVSREHDLGDSIMTAIVCAPFAKNGAAFHDLGRLRLQETERVQALKTELNKCSAPEIFAVEQGDSLRIARCALHGAEIETYHDHRMAMCFATLGLIVSGIRIRNPACVKKTFPNFFQKLAAAPPEGLGANIIDSATGAFLNGGELFAE